MERAAVIPASWRPFFDATKIPAAVIANGMLHLTGHTGDHAEGTFSSEAVEQIRQTFRNVATTLEEAGATWSDVVDIRTFHVAFRQHADAALIVAAEFLEDPYPAWTAVGVTELFEPEALFEMAVTAVLPRDVP
jgi:enamine deaminase RidA (YjgF/YER057c/UK114 family)